MVFNLHKVFLGLQQNITDRVVDPTIGPHVHVVLIKMQHKLFPGFSLPKLSEQCREGNTLVRFPNPHYIVTFSWRI